MGLQARLLTIITIWVVSNTGVGQGQGWSLINAMKEEKNWLASRSYKGEVKLLWDLLDKKLRNESF
jgi:hypothetical protein